MFKGMGKEALCIAGLLFFLKKTSGLVAALYLYGVQITVSSCF